MLQSAVPVLRVADYDRARVFWRNILRFEIVEEGGNPPRFGIFARDGQRVFIDGWRGPDPRSHDGWRVYFHVDDVDRLAAEVIAAGADVARSPHDAVYGMREFEVDDPDGNRLCFGKAIGPG